MSHSLMPLCDLCEQKEAGLGNAVMSQHTPQCRRVSHAVGGIYLTPKLEAVTIGVHAVSQGRGLSQDSSKATNPKTSAVMSLGPFLRVRFG